jgi:hypothetical protein
MTVQVSYPYNRKTKLTSVQLHFSGCRQKIVRNISWIWCSFCICISWFWPAFWLSHKHSLSYHCIDFWVVIMLLSKWTYSAETIHAGVKYQSTCINLQNPDIRGQCIWNYMVDKNVFAWMWVRPGNHFKISQVVNGYRVLWLTQDSCYDYLKYKDNFFLLFQRSLPSARCCVTFCKTPFWYGDEWQSDTPYLEYLLLPSISGSCLLYPQYEEML